MSKFERTACEMDALAFFFFLALDDRERLTTTCGFKSRNRNYSGVLVDITVTASHSNKV